MLKNVSYLEFLSIIFVLWLLTDHQSLFAVIVWMFTS